MIAPIYLIRAEDDLVALHLALALSKHIPTALWRPGEPESALDNLAVVGDNDLWQAVLNARHYAVALVYAGEGPADFVVKGSTGCRTYGIYSNLLKRMEEHAARVAVHVLDWQTGEIQLDLERREGELPKLVVVVPIGVDVRRLIKALRRYKPVLHRNLAAGLADEILPRVKRKWPDRGVVIAPSAADAPVEALEIRVGNCPDCVPLEDVEQELNDIILQSPCIFGEYEEPAEFKPKGRPKPLPPSWIRKLAQGVVCKHESLCLYAIHRWPRLAYYMRRFPDPDKLAALALWNEGQLLETLKAFAARRKIIDVPDYTEQVLSTLREEGVVAPQIRAAPPRRPPLVGRYGYSAVKFSLLVLAVLGFLLAPHTFGLSFALPAIYMAVWPDAVLALFYSSRGVAIEPRLYYLGNGRHRDAFGRTHVVYRVTPLVNALRATPTSAYRAYIAMINDLPLTPKEAVEMRYEEDKAILRYVGENWESIRGRLRRYFLFFEPVAISQADLPAGPLRALTYILSALGAIAAFTLAGYLTAGMLAYPFVALVLRRRARAYAAGERFYGLSRFDVFSLNAHEDPSGAHEAAKIMASRSREWGVIIVKDPRVDDSFMRKFYRLYVSPFDVGKEKVKLLRYSRAVERITTGGERGVRVQAFTRQPIDPSGNMIIDDPMGALDRWFLWATKPALSGDLVALPFLGPVRYSGKAILVGKDEDEQAIYFYPDIMPALHTVIYGPTGMGKTWTAATLLLRLREAGYNLHVTIVDPHGDYVDLRDLLGAKVVAIGEKDYIDVFSEGDEEMEALAEKLSAEALGKPMGLDEVRDFYKATLVGKAISLERAKDAIIAFSERARDSQAFMRIYGSLLIYQLYRHAFRTIKEGTDELWVILLDEAYLFITPSILENLMLGARKFGVAVWLIAHKTDLLTEGVLAATPLKIFIGGSTTVDFIGRAIQLDPEDVKWLRTAFPPRAFSDGAQTFSGSTQALMIHGPADLRYHAHIMLDPRVKERRTSAANRRTSTISKP